MVEEDDIPSLTLREVIEPYKRGLAQFEEQSKLTHAVIVALGLVVGVVIYLGYLHVTNRWELANMGNPPHGYNLEAIHARKEALALTSAILGVYWGCMFVLQKGGPILNMLYVAAGIIAPLIVHSHIISPGKILYFRRSGGIGYIIDLFHIALPGIIAFGVILRVFGYWIRQKPEKKAEWEEKDPLNIINW